MTNHRRSVSSINCCSSMRRVCCCGPGTQEISINCCTAGAQQQPWAVSRCQLTQEAEYRTCLSTVMQWQNHCQYSSSGMLKQCQQCQDKQTHPFNGPFPGLPRWASTRKVKPSWILLKQETLSGSGISCAIYKSAPCSRQITTPAPHHSLFYTPDALLATQPTASKRSRHNVKTNLPCNIFLVVGTGNRSAPMQSHSAASRLAISNAKILIYLSNKIYGSNFIKKLRPINGGKTSYNRNSPLCTGNVPSSH